MTARISRDAYGLKLAEAAALRADCTRRQVGAVIIAPDGSVVSTGYNGLSSGLPGCASAGACPRGQMAYPEPPIQVGQPDPTGGPFARMTDYCGKTIHVEDDVWTCTQDVGDHLWHIAGDGDEVCHVWTEAPTQPGDVSYESTGCRAVHAEVNAILRGRGREGCAGATIYVTDTPCFHCSVVIEGAGIVRVVTPTTEDEGQSWPQEDAEPPLETLAALAATPRPYVPPTSVLEAIAVSGTTTGETVRVEVTPGGFPLDLYNALQRQEAAQAHRAAAVRRAELAEEHEGWRGL